MKLVLPLILLALAIPLAFPSSPAYAQIQLTEMDPPDGAQLDEPPEVVHLCFSQPVDIQEITSFRFTYRMPDDRPLGLRIVFSLDRECVDVFPDLPDDPPSGEYTFQWQVTAAEGDEEGSGTLRFQVGEGGTPAAPPPSAPGGTPPSGTPPAGGQEAGGGGDDGPDILLMALITTASVGGAAVLFTLGYLLRRRIGFDPHRPPEGGEGGGGEH